MQRTMFLVRDARLPHPVVVDLYRLTSAAQHTYDYPVHFRGPLIATSVKYRPNVTRLEPLGEKHGYEHIWREGAGTTDSTLHVTWLDGNRYYTVTTSGAPATEVIFGRTGANDPNFNLISEPLMLVRRRAADHVFASVIEPHGYFSEPQERSEQARPLITSVRVLGQNSEATVVEVAGADGLRWVVMTTNGPASATARHRVTFGGQTFEWTGNYDFQGVR
jgi:oligo-alginate lyase